MAEPIARIFIETTLDTSTWERDLRIAQGKINALPPVKPRVDAKDLHDLNKLLDLKQRHLRETVDYYDRNPIVPRVDTQQLDNILGKKHNIAAEVSTGVLTKQRNIVAGILGAPIDIAIAVPKQIATGLLQGLGRDVSKAIGDTLTSTLNAALGDSIGSVGLLISKFSDDLGKKAALAVNSSKNNIAENATILADLRKYVGAEDIAIERQSIAARKNSTQASKRNLARTGVLQEARTAEKELQRSRRLFEEVEKLAPAKLREIAAEKEEAQEFVAYLTERIEGQTPRKIKEMAIVERAKAKEKIKGLEAQREKLQTLYVDNRDNYLFSKDRQASTTEDVKALVEKALPKEYQRLLDAIAPKLSRQNTPALRRMSEAEAASAGANGMYSAYENQIALNPGLYDRVQAGGKLSLADRRILAEEIAHGRDMSFGSSLASAEAVRDRQLATDKRIRPASGDAEFARSIEKELQNYSPEMRELERNGKLQAYRAARQLEQEDAQRIIANRNILAGKRRDRATAAEEGEDIWSQEPMPSGFRSRQSGKVRNRRQVHDPLELPVIATELVREPIDVIAAVKSAARNIKGFEDNLLDDYSLGLGRKIKTVIIATSKNLALDRADDAKRLAGKALNVAGRQYDVAKRLEAGVLGMAPLGLGAVAKTALQGVGTMGLLSQAGMSGQLLQSLLTSGASSVVGGGTHLLAGSGGISGAVIEGLGASLQTLSPMIGAGVLAKGAESAIGGLLPGQTTQNSRSIKQLQAANARIVRQLQSSVITNALSGGQDAVAEIGGALSIPVSRPAIERTPDAILRFKKGLDQLWSNAASALNSGNAAKAAALYQQAKASAADLLAANKEVYQSLPKGDERDRLSSLNGDIGRQNNIAKARLKKIERELREGRDLKQVELVPDNDITDQLANLRSQQRKKKLVGADPITNAKFAAERAEDSIAAFESAGSAAPASKIEIPQVAKGINDMRSKIVLGITGLGVIATGLAVAMTGINKALERQSATRALETVSTSQLAAQRSLDSASALAAKLGLGKTEVIQQAASFRANLEGTGLESISDQLSEGISLYGRAQGASSEQLSRGRLAFGQVAGKPKLSAEELNQLDESIPGFGNLLASSSGYSKGQLRALAGKGKIQSSDILQNLAPTLQAEGAAKAASLETSQAAQLGRFSAAAEDAQVSLANSLLTVVAPAADLAAKAITGLVASLSFLGTAAVVALAGFVGQIVITQGALLTLGQGLSVAALGVKALVIAAMPLAAVAAIAAVFEGGRAIFDLYNGNNSPAKKMTDEYLKTADALDRVRNKTKELSAAPRIEAEGLGEGFASFAYSVGRGVTGLLGGNTKDKPQDFAELKGAEEQNRLTESVNRLRSDRVARPSIIPAQEIKQTAILNEQIKTLQLEAKAFSGKESEGITKERGKKISALINQKNDLATNAALLKRRIEAEIKVLEAIASNDISTPEARKAAQKDLDKQKTTLDTLNSASSASTDNIIRLNDRIEQSVVGFDSYGSSIERLALSEAADTTDAFGGSLREGAKATREFGNAWTDLQRRINASREKQAVANSLLREDSIAQEVRIAQRSGKLPQNLAETSAGQISKLKEFGFSEQVGIAISLSNEAALELAKNTQAQSKLVADRKTAISRENQALQDNYKQQIQSSITAASEIARQMQQSRTANYSAALSNSLINIQGAVGNYINSTIEQFKKLQEITTARQDALAKQSEIAMSKIKAADERDTSIQQSSGSANSTTAATSNSGAVVSPVVGGRAANSDSGLPVQRYGAGRGKGTHKGEDYTGALGADVRAVVGGRITEYRRDVRWSGHVSALAVSIQSADADGKELVTRYFHIGEKAGKSLKVGMTVGAGDVIGVIGRDGRVGGNEYHVDIKTKVNGKFQDPSVVFDKLAKKAATTTGSVSTTPTAPASTYSGSGSLLTNVLSMIAKGEVGTIDASGYYKRQGSGSFSASEAAKGFPSVGKNENIGRYQVNLNDYNLARKTNKKITNFLPESQDLIAIERMKTANGYGGDKGWSAMARFEANPTQSNADLLFRDLGAEWEALRNGKDRYKGKDRRNNYRGKLYGSDESIYNMLVGGIKRTNTKPAATIATQSASADPASNQLIDATYQNKIATAEAAMKASVSSTDIAVKTIGIEAQSISYKRFQQKTIDDRKQAADVRAKKQEQRLKVLDLGNSSTSKDSRKQQTENQFYVDEIRIKIKQNEEDNKQEVQELARQKKIFTQLLSADYTNPEQKAVARDFLKDLPELEKQQKELYKNTRLGLDQDIRIGKKTKDEVARKQRIKTRQEDNLAAVASQNSAIAVDEEKLKTSEEYLKLNPYDYKYGDPLTMRKQIDIRKQQQANATSLAKLQDDINALDPTAGNYTTQKKRLEEQKANLAKESSLKLRNIHSAYQGANTTRQLDRKAYADEIANRSIGRSIDSQRILANYESAQGRIGKAAETMAQVEAEERSVKLLQQINELKRAAVLDPRLRPNLDAAIKEVQYQKQLLDYTAERVRWKEREVNLRSLANEAAGLSFEGRDLDIQALGRLGNNYDAKSETGRLAKDRLELEYNNKVRELQERRVANEASPNSPFYQETKNQLEAIALELDNINGKKLDQLNKEFSQFQGVIDETAREGTRVLQDMVSGKGIDSNSLNQLLVAPFKAINDQIASFLGGQWSQFVNDLMGGLVKELNNTMDGMGSASSPSGGNIFSMIVKGITGFFGGSSGDSGNNPAYDSLDNYASGGRLSGVASNPAFAALPPVRLAMERERRESGGREPVAIVANRDEMVLNPAQTRDYLSDINNYAAGGALSSYSVTLARTKAVDIQQPTYRPLELKTTIIDNVETVSIEQLNAAIANSQQQGRRALEESNRAQQDRMAHSVEYRQSMGLI